MSQPLVSIITITLNRADLIHRCIESIQRQTYTNYEHIIVDGNSDDNTEEVVLAYNDPHIRYIKLDRRGPEVQMRAGSSVAKGKYITLLDDDDEYLPEKLEKQVALFETEPANVGLVYCWMTYFRNDDPDKIVSEHRNEYRGFVGDITPGHPMVTGTPTLMFRKEVFDEFGGAFDDSIGRVMSDWEFVARITQKYEVDFVPESLVKVYVDHGHTQLTNEVNQQKRLGQIKFHFHFLTEFSDVFQRYPKSADFHYYNIAVHYGLLHERKQAWKYFRKYLGTKPKFVDSLKAIYHIALGR